MTSDGQHSPRPWIPRRVHTDEQGPLAVSAGGLTRNVVTPVVCVRLFSVRPPRSSALGNGVGRGIAGIGPPNVETDLRMHEPDPLALPVSRPAHEVARLVWGVLFGLHPGTPTERGTERGYPGTYLGGFDPASGRRPEGNAPIAPSFAH